MRVITLRAGAAALLVGALAALLLTARPGPAGAAPTTQVFDVAGPFSRTIDVGKKGFSPGDSILERHPLLDPATGDRVGTSVTHVRIVKPRRDGDVLAIIDCTLDLQKGKVTFYGAFRFSELAGTGAVLPITGGTSDLIGAEGAVTLTGGELDGQEGTNIALDLTS